MLNSLTQSIPSSPTLAISEKAAALKKQGKNVINLSVGEPDLPIPSWIRQAAIQAIEEGQQYYTPVAGLPELRAAIVEKLNRENQLSGYLPSQVIVGCGAKQVIYNAMMASLEPGDEVIIPTPYWVSYPPMVTLAGGKPVIIGCDTHLKITPQILQQAITPRTKWFILNSPSNPTGAVYTSEELRALADVLVDHPHVWILSDDIYEHLTYPPFSFTSLIRINPSLRERTLLVNGVSKSFSMTGWRIGYGVGPQELINGMIKIQSHSTSGASCIAQFASISALTSAESPPFLQERAHIFQERRDTLVQGLLPLTERLDPPAGAFYVFFDARSLLQHKKIDSDVTLAHRLLEEALVSCVPGTEFGLPGYLRFSYALDKELLQKATDYITSWAQG